MSKRKHIADFFVAKKKTDTDIDGEDKDDESNTPKPSKPNHNAQLTLKVERIACSNGNDNLHDFDFIFQLSGTSTERSNTECSGDRMLSGILESTLKINIEGTVRVHEKVEIEVKPNSKCKEIQVFLLEYS